MRRACAKLPEQGAHPAMIPEGGQG
jgi:hypothetical protein